MGIKIFKESPGIISKDSCWIIYKGNFMYIHTYLLGAIWQMITNWNNEKHLIG